MWGMAQEMGLEFVDLDLQSTDFAAAYHLPEATARHHNVLVFGNRDGVPLVAASNPTDVFAMDDLRTIIGRTFITVVATRSQINTYIDRAYHQGGDATEVAQSAASDFDDTFDEDLSNLQAVVDDAPIVRYVNLLVLQALNERASDIHVEPTGENLRIRYRIDGVLHDISTAPRAIAAAVTTRLKVMSDMNIAEHRLPQDGRISLTVGSRSIDLRIATLPTIYGEKVVMRVLDKSNIVLGFEDLGFDDDLLAIYKGIYTKPYGTILVTGPDRLRQDDDPVRHAGGPQRAGEEHHHGGGPGRAAPEGDQPGAAQHQGRPELRRRSQVDPAVGPRHRAGGRDPGPRDGDDDHRSLPHRPPGPGHAAHERLGQHSDAAGGDGHGTVPGDLGAVGRSGPAAGPSAVRALPRGLRADGGRDRGGRMDPRRALRRHPTSRCSTGPSAARPVPQPGIWAARPCSNCSSSPSRSST